jgi:hypothetical protein
MHLGADGGSSPRYANVPSAPSFERAPLNQRRKKKMKKIKFNGTRRKGTLYPRRIWSPGEIYIVEDDVALELEEDPDFIVLGKKGGKA